jgi:hypothetical protein
MKVRMKVFLTFVTNIVGLFVINVIKIDESEYNIGLFVIIIIAGSTAGIITIWSKYPKNFDAKTIN